MKYRYPAAALALAALLSACGAQQPAEQPGATVQGQSATEAPSTPQKPAEDRCLPVSAEMMQAIAGGSEDSLPITPVAGAAVKSKDYKEVYMIAMKFSAPGGPDEVGVWASGSTTPGESLILAVDGYATNFTHWPDGGKSSYKITQADDGVAESEACLQE